MVNPPVKTYWDEIGPFFGVMGWLAVFGLIWFGLFALHTGLGAAAVILAGLFGDV